MSLDFHFAGFLAQEVVSGRYRSASEVVRAGLRLLEDRETQMAALRAATLPESRSGGRDSAAPVVRLIGGGSATVPS
ncbi:type II toxin-antitoxin system ParD family antitoxin [Aeromicrobium sp.]|uniref:type II toxin-antitoxin system ParD family antitoxin n=1 Tax=Aeromicrobium sp. TaxID=1871063 RepID=UPI0039E6BA77